MATCHDCLHHAACATFADGKDWEQTWITYGKNGQCEDFKDKSLFVEVVRCRHCKHWQPIHEHIPHMECQIFCGAYEHGYPTNADDYCSYGERCNNE